MAGRAGTIRAVIDEDELVDITSFGGDVRYLRVGLDRAESLARRNFIDGLIEVDEFEAEIERILHKRQQPVRP